MKNASVSIEKYFWIFVIGLIFILNISQLVSDGMFMDAEQYTGVAHNLALGKGTFWNPYQSKLAQYDGLPFREQPPLLFGIQSIFFKLLGDSMYVERFYMLLVFALLVLMLLQIWKHLAGQQIVASTHNYLPILLWIIMPTAFWGFANNVHENGMSVFTLLSVMISFFALEKNKRNWWFVLSGLCIVAATLSKGVPGLFPLAIPLLYWLVFQKITFQKMIGVSVILVITLIAAYAVLLTNSEANESLHFYFYHKLLARVKAAPTVDSHWQTIIYLLQDVIVPFVIVLVLYFSFKKKNTETINQIKKKYLLFFLLCGLAAALPLMITRVQRSFYNIPSLPFFAMATAIYCNTYFVMIGNWLANKKIRSNAFVSFSTIVLVVGIVLSIKNIGTYKRDAECLHDVYIIKKNVPQFTDISTRAILFEDWSLQCYLIRYNNNSLDFKDTILNYFLLEKGMATPDSNYQIMDLPLIKYNLFQKKI